MAPRFEMSHSGELKPMMETAWCSSRPSCSQQREEDKLISGKLWPLLLPIMASIIFKHQSHAADELVTKPKDESSWKYQ
jgi:hypothetical protein